MLFVIPFLQKDILISHYRGIMKERIFSLGFDNILPPYIFLIRPKIVNIDIYVGYSFLFINTIFIIEKVVKLLKNKLLKNIVKKKF